MGLFRYLSLAKKVTSHSQSHYIEVVHCAGRHFYGTEYEIWADFGPVGNTEKKDGLADYEQLLRRFFHVFSVRTKKLHKMPFKQKKFEFFFSFFFSSFFLTFFRAKIVYDCVLLY